MARMGDLQRLAIVSRREAVDGVRVPPCVKRVEQLRPKAVAVVPHRRHVREVVCPHIQLSQHPLEREQETALGLRVDEGYRQGLQRRVW